MTERRHHFETWSYGFDEQLQGVGGDAYGTPFFTGLRVPTLASPSVSNRYLFMLCGFQLAERVKARIVGWRQLATIGLVSAGNLLEQEILSPVFRFPDGNISWHLRMVPGDLLESLTGGLPPPISPTNNLAFRMSNTPALLYETATLTGSGNYVDLTAYTPPNLGRPYGEPVGQFTTLPDLRTPWRDAHAWSALDLPIEGPGFFALFASVKQTAGTSHAAPTNPGGEPIEWQFIANHPTAIYWRVGGALIVDIDDAASEPEGAQTDA